MMKKGMASSENELMPWSVCCATSTIGMSRYQRVTREESASTSATGKRRTRRTVKLTHRIQVATVVLADPA